MRRDRRRNGASTMPTSSPASSRGTGSSSTPKRKPWPGTAPSSPWPRTCCRSTRHAATWQKAPCGGTLHGLCHAARSRRRHARRRRQAGQGLGRGRGPPRRFPLENHNRFHIDYELTCYRFLYYDAAMYRLGRNPLPGDAPAPHPQRVQKVMLRCTDAARFAVYVSDNDWKRYSTPGPSRPASHGYIALTESSPLASALEEQALREAVSYWRAFPRNGVTQILTSAAGRGRRELPTSCSCTCSCRRRPHHFAGPGGGAAPAASRSSRTSTC